MTSQSTEIRHLQTRSGPDGSAPLAVTLLIAAVAATLLTLLVGTARITQLRRRLAGRRPTPTNK
ncbi:hypothetical protein F1D05_30330 [Kribbella qitaiheensis]|uniref:Uncharacterized protein n=1 Tax=Kribbella qitaiheensis TaxID=1544730 RepID=A0A7G6X5C3_9ACTN|nr:hypothetical protein [Kribbella qitaiheensis]QNE21438.1 hypothetical protein F1D05_30330 [Kribbella qitaiheensis]